jgi:ketosteroid isomerase-like protein
MAKSLRFVLLVAALIADVAVARAGALTPAETLAKIEKDYAEMQITKNETTIRAVASIMSDDMYFFDVAGGGKAGKAAVLDSIRSPDLVVTSMDFPAFSVQIFGSTAIVRGTNAQTGSRKGKDIGGTYVWLDIFEERSGHWIWIASTSTKVGVQITAEFTCDKRRCLTSQPGFSLKGSRVN